MTTGYICDRCGAAFASGGKWLQGGYHGGTVPMQWWDLCPDCMDGFAEWMDCDRESVREHSLESESVREQSESVRERRYESQDVTGGIERVTESPEMSHDTREKLEAAAQTAAGCIYGRGFTNGLADAWNDDEVDTAASQIIQLLDRQAAITGREWMAYREVLVRENCDQVDELIAERDQWKDAYGDSERLRLELVKGLEHARKWNDTWRGLVRRYEGLCDGLLDERDRLRGEAS